MLRLSYRELLLCVGYLELSSFLAELEELLPPLSPPAAFVSCSSEDLEAFFLTAAGEEEEEEEEEVPPLQVCCFASAAARSNPSSAMSGNELLLLLHSTGCCCLNCKDEESLLRWCKRKSKEGRLVWMLLPCEDTAAAERRL
jgi:hypothetical protein